MRALSHLVAICLSMCLVATALAASKLPAKKLQYDPKLPVVDVFEAMEAGTIETTVIARDANEANLFVTNKSDSPVSVKLPPAMVAVQVLKQNIFGQNRGANGGAQNGGNMMGGAQPMGVGMNNNNPGGVNNNMQNNGFQMNGNGNGNGNGFFSVPSQKTVQVPLKGICLAEGKPDPRPRMTYKLVKLETYTADPALQEALKLFATSEIDLQSAQAAIWHLTDKMSWNDLRGKQIERLGGLDPLPYFSDKQIDDAEKLIDDVRKKIDSAPRKAETAAR